MARREFALVLSPVLCLLPALVTAQGEGATTEPSASAPALESATTNALSDEVVPAIAIPRERPPLAVAGSKPRSARLDTVKTTAVAFVGGAAATVIAVPTALLAGSLIGALPPNLIAAVVPTILVAGLVPPVLVAGSEWLLQAWLGGEAGSFWWTWGATTVVHVGALVVGALLGVSTSNAVTLAGLVGVEALLLPTTATAVLLLTRPGADSEN